MSAQRHTASHAGGGGRTQRPGKGDGHTRYPGKAKGDGRARRRGKGDGHTSHSAGTERTSGEKRPAGRGGKGAARSGSKQARASRPDRKGAVRGNARQGRGGSKQSRSGAAAVHGNARQGRGGSKPIRKQGKPARAGKAPAFFCPIDEQCGGCELLWQPYAEQLADKQRFVEHLFRPLLADFGMAASGADAAEDGASAPAGGTDGGTEKTTADAAGGVAKAAESSSKNDGMTASVRFDAIMGMDVPLHYRDKVLSPFVGVWDKRARRERILCGMYARGTHRVIDSGACLIENELAKAIILDVCDLMVKFHIPPYDEDTDEGFMRHAQVRVGHRSGEVMVTLVTRDEAFPSSRHFARELARRHPEVTTVVQNVNGRQTNVVLGDKERTLYGPGFILDSLCGLTFRISSKSFYQVNSTQTEVLYRRAIQMAHLTGTERVLDAYCGTGTIGLVAMHGVDPDRPQAHAAELIGVEERRDAVADARMNARHNGIEQARFVAEDAGAFMRKLAADASRAAEDGDGRRQSEDGIDVVFMDPPRAGSTPEFLKALDRLAPRRVVYISCNPKTQVRDVRFLCERGWYIEEIQPVDMFPHTKHVETIVSLARAKG